jgi:hypothetical protein
MSATTESAGGVRFRKFQEMLLTIQGDPGEAARFNAVVQSPAALADYSASKGVPITEAEAQGVFAAAQRLAEAQLGEARAAGRTLEDAELDGVNGGVSWAAIGGTLGVIAGVALGTLAAPALATGAIAIGSAEFIGMAVGSAAAGGLSGGAWGGAIGGAAQGIANLIKD